MITSQSSQQGSHSRIRQHRSRCLLFSLSWSCSNTTVNRLERWSRCSSSVYLGRFAACSPMAVFRDLSLQWQPTREPLLLLASVCACNPCLSMCVSFSLPGLSFSSLFCLLSFPQGCVTVWRLHLSSALVYPSRLLSLPKDTATYILFLCVP